MAFTKEPSPFLMFDYGEGLCSLPLCRLNYPCSILRRSSCSITVRGFALYHCHATLSAQLPLLHPSGSVEGCTAQTPQRVHHVHALPYADVRCNGPTLTTRTMLLMLPCTTLYTLHSTFYALPHYRTTALRTLSGEGAPKYFEATKKRRGVG